MILEICVFWQVLDTVNGGSFRKTVSNKFITVQKVACNMFLGFKAFQNLLLKDRLGFESKNRPKTQENVFWTL